MPIVFTKYAKDDIAEVLERSGSFDAFVPIFFEVTLEALLRTGERAPGYSTDRLRNIVFLAEAIIADRES